MAHIIALQARGPQLVQRRPAIAAKTLGRPRQAPKQVSAPRQARTAAAGLEEAGVEEDLADLAGGRRSTLSPETLAGSDQL